MRLTREQIESVRMEIEEIRGACASWADEDSPNMAIGMHRADVMEDQLMRIIQLQTNLVLEGHLRLKRQSALIESDS